MRNLIQAIEEVTECLVFENNKIPGFTLSRIESLKKEYEKYKQEKNDESKNLLN